MFKISFSKKCYLSIVINCTIATSPMYDRLKGKVLKRAGLMCITPADCKLLSEYIHQAVGKSVSVTTLKRFFGFASLNFHFSKYTLISLAEYSEHDPKFVQREALNHTTIPGKKIHHIEFELEDGTLLSCNYFKEATFVEFEHVTGENDRSCFILDKQQVAELLKAFS